MNGAYDPAAQMWRGLLSDAVTGRPILFLDRDGVIVEEVHYLCRVEDTRVIPGAARLIAAANRAGIAVAVVTNQGGIGLGKYDWPEFEAVQAEMRAQLAVFGARLDAVYACPFHEKGQPPWQAIGHPNRKPGPGMLVRAAQDLASTAAGGWIVGDRATDMAAGRAAGCAGGTVVRTGHGTAAEVTAAQAVGAEDFRIEAATDAGGAVGVIARLSPSP